ncbi:MAG: bifunctional glutamate N-acetyltransferase/amino-acid acetyltransferase ArgJ [Planctomycetes bacterium]|nr:bifunctional glutamate N-acetyltransferase/amino-acid acetyltransferase ArgJ [Planctomycetota bacterium]
MANRTITSPLGFRVSAVKAGIKSSGKSDLGLIVSDKACRAAAVFTTNKTASASVVLSRDHVKSGVARAIYVSSGNANACTGKRGTRDAHSICRHVATALGIDEREVLVTTTGIIGEYLPMDKVRNGITQAISGLSRSAAAGQAFGRAIMTTDTRPKTAYEPFRLGGKWVKVAGATKGAGMIAPNMATMLGYITTDVNIATSLLRRTLREAVDHSFNKLTIDNHESTNDCVIILASGLADHKPIKKPGSELKKFSRALLNICDSLARQIAADGEGARCAVTLKVTGAASALDADQALRAISDSFLVRTAFHGADPNWGRIVSAIGFSGARFDETKLSCKIAGRSVYRNGRPVRFDPKELTRRMRGKYWEVEVALGAGKYEDFRYTCDISSEYVKINADYHT